MCKIIGLLITVITFVIVLVIVVVESSLYKPNNYIDEACNLKPDKVVEYFFNAWNEKNFSKMDAVLSNKMKAKTVDYYSVNEVSVISSEQIDVSEAPSTVEGLQEVIVYRVKLVIKRDDDSIRDEIYTCLCYIGKESGDSPWLLYDMA